MMYCIPEFTCIIFIFALEDMTRYNLRTMICYVTNCFWLQTTVWRQSWTHHSHYYGLKSSRQLLAHILHRDRDAGPSISNKNSVQSFCKMFSLRSSWLIWLFSPSFHPLIFFPFFPIFHFPTIFHSNALWASNKE